MPNNIVLVKIDSETDEPRFYRGCGRDKWSAEYPDAQLFASVHSIPNKALVPGAKAIRDYGLNSEAVVMRVSEHEDHSDRRICQAEGCEYGDH
jgi:hypothetical protein